MLTSVEHFVHNDRRTARTSKDQSNCPAYYVSAIVPDSMVFSLDGWHPDTAPVSERPHDCKSNAHRQVHRLWSHVDLKADHVAHTGRAFGLLEPRTQP